MRLLTTWRLPLRLARRDALRHPARSLLVLVMIALPVLAVTTADVVISTSQVSGPESVDRRMGAAQALVTVTDGVDDVKQAPDPDSGFPQLDGDGETPAPSAEQVSSLLDGAALVELRQSEVQVATDKGRTSAEAVETDLADPVTAGLYDLTSGRLPRAPDEVAVNQALLDKGYAVGDRLEVDTDTATTTLTIVGVAESTTARSFPTAFGLAGSLGVDTTGTTTWLVDGGPVSWSTVRQLNAIGALVASRAVIDNPPPVSQWPPEVQPSGSGDSIAVLALIVVMVLIEVVLLAGPAFAVSARKQQRSLALLAASGGTPEQARRVIIGGAVVLGSVAAVLGVGLGIGLARLVQPLVQARSDLWFGPFEVPWLHLAGVAAFGLVSALLAAAVPSYLASRQDVVAVLAGRRGDRAPSLKSPVLGLVLLGVGVLGSVAGATRSGGGETLIAFSAIPAVLGMVLLVPVLLAGLAKVSARLPLVLRYAVRDANRHRSRTVPAISAVAATVAGVVALGIGLSSDAAENEATYSASLPRDVAMVSASGPDISWGAMRSVVERELPGSTVTDQQGLSESNGFTEVLDGQQPLLDQSGSSTGAGVMVSDTTLPLGLIGVSAADASRAADALAAGRVVAFVNDERADGEVTVVRHTFDEETGEEEPVQRVRAAATFITVGNGWVGPNGVVPTAVADELGTAAATVALAVTGPPITERQEQAVDEGLSAVDQFSSMYVERGYQPDDATVIAQLVLVLMGGALMLGGTLTATFLALSDARPDLATLSAVGASPRMRRGVAAAYAVVVGLVGALVGAVVGFIPGVAVTWPLTTATYNDPVTGPFLDVPWLMVLGLVVVLPAVTALIVGLAARSRLPLVARLD